MKRISFENRTVIVTGAGGGLGRTYAIELARRGAAVIVNDLGGTIHGTDGGPEMADGVVAEITAFGGRAVANYDSVATKSGGARIVGAALDNFGRIDAVINNAGNIRNDWFGDIKDRELRSQIDTHLLGTFYVTQAAWPHMVAQRYGRLVFTTSGVGMLGNPGQASYGAAKGGIIGLMHVVSLEAARQGILCNAVQPNALNRMQPEMDRTTDDEAAGRFAMVVPALGESMQPKFTTPLAVYLASNACQSSHSIYSSLGGRFSRVFIGVTSGWQGSRAEPSTVEDIAQHIEEIRDETAGFTIPADLIDEYEILLADPSHPAEAAL